ncbi:hypothetical protein Taro_027795 [Colocasia esculenta]|uniref:Uncharacterized protein n=1 Tax=Colocasia esculenta TaxID=4460 RepID=A0A843VPV6_COLES|nr:hypothetical protein [Colocasia esculenta]
MGNCIRVQPSGSWADDCEEWEWAEATHRQRHFVREVATAEESELLKGESMARQRPATQVTIMISKKQLEELLRNADPSQGLSLQILLENLVPGTRGGALPGCSRRWRPALDSVPEVSE